MNATYSSLEGFAEEHRKNLARAGRAKLPVDALAINLHRFRADAKFTTDPPDPAQLRGRGLLLIAALSDTAEFVPAPPGQVSVRITRHLTYEDPTALSR